MAYQAVGCDPGDEGVRLVDAAPAIVLKRKGKGIGDLVWFGRRKWRHAGHAGQYRARANAEGVDRGASTRSALQPERPMGPQKVESRNHRHAGYDHRLRE
jgi:hypothetical protein